MNDKRDFDRAVDRWLDDGSDATPPEVIEAVLLAVRSTPQERDFRVPWRTASMTPYMRIAAVIATVAVASAAALYAFGSKPDVGSGPPLQPTTQSTLPQPTASTDNPDAALGAWDREAFEGRFGVEFSPYEQLTRSSNIAYVADESLTFVVDLRNAIVGTAIESPLPDRNAATEDEWLAFIAETQPDVAEWLMSARDDYLAAPGAEVSLAQWFGGLCAQFGARPPIFEPGSDATSLYMFAQYEEDCP